MRTLPRDHELLTTVSRFGMMTSRQIRAVVFRGLTSESGWRSAKKRLTLNGQLVKLDVPGPGGALGGRSPETYRLGREGWKVLGRQGSYRERRSTDYHALDIVDLHIRFLDAQDEGWMELRYYEIESEAARNFNGLQLEPDVYVEIVNVERNTIRPFIIEVDRGSEHRPEILRKVRDFVAAKRENDTVGHYPRFPDVIFLANTATRAEQLKRWVGRNAYVGDERVFYFGTLDSFPGVLRPSVEEVQSTTN